MRGHPRSAHRGNALSLAQTQFRFPLGKQISASNPRLKIENVWMPGGLPAPFEQPASRC